MKLRNLARTVLLASVLLTMVGVALAEPAKSSDDTSKKSQKKARKNAAATLDDQVKATTAGSSAGVSAASTTKPKPKYPPFAEVIKEAETIDGLIKLHKKGTRLYAEISPSHLNRDFIVLISIARGIGETPLLGGMSWGFGDDWIWQFRKVDERIQIVRRNVRFTATKGSPSERAVRLAYTDSVLFSLPITTMSPSGAYVVDLGAVLMSDLPQISSVLRGFVFSRDKSSWASVKGFKDNVEVQVAATYASGGTAEFDGVPDSRGVTLNVHYSISRLPETGYQPRLADDRVGYFNTVMKDYSRNWDDEHFVRYINRWDLRKADPKAELSPPKRPIVFWIEKTVPFEYRKPVREGILEWNKAFEKAGFVNAIEVRQQPDDADWDPEDINYNTFRWITASAGFAMGPSRVNPKTGEILDADIIFDSDFLESWKTGQEIFTPDEIAEQLGGPFDIESYREKMSQLPPNARRHHATACNQCAGMASQMAFGTLSLEADPKIDSKKELEKLIAQGLKEVVMHEVGHTLGLRHNFKASTMLTLAEMQDPKKTRDSGLAASVMDYMPINRAPKGEPQGDYYSQTIGPYDLWAIQYGYKTISGNGDAERSELNKIAVQGAKPPLNYATDENARGFDPDPLVNRFDLGKDPIEYALLRAQQVRDLLPGLVERVTDEGEGYQRARLAFNMLLSHHGRGMHFAARYIGGLHEHRAHRGDPQAQPPFVVVAAEEQRKALALLNDEVFGVDSYQFPAELYNLLAPSKWTHWGTSPLDRSDFPVHDAILSWQETILSQLLSSTTLQRLYDSELKVPAESDAFTCAELLSSLTEAVFAELKTLPKGKFSNREPGIQSLRRALQRRFTQRLSRIALGDTLAPPDCQALAQMELEQLEQQIRKMLRGKSQLDSYTRAHLRETAERIGKVRDARLQLYAP